MTPPELYQEAARRGLRLEPHGSKLRVIPGDRVPPDFADVLRRHKAELLSWLEGRAARLREDEIPWLHVAKQVLSGEFEGADRSTVESLIIGLQRIAHRVCHRALDHLRNQKRNSITP